MKFTKDLSDLSPVLSAEIIRLRNALTYDLPTREQQREFLEWAQSLPTLGPYLCVDDITDGNTKLGKPISGQATE